MFKHKKIEKDLVSIVTKRPRAAWYLLIILSLTGVLSGLWAMYQTIYHGIGTWGLNNSVAWGLDITNFVWWIGVAHAGTFISAILLLLRQPWRMAVNRSAEAMTIVAVMCAGIFPIIHLGRIAYVHYILPIPSQTGVWVNFNSPLVWDIFAISTYFIISLLFWYIGMIPDFAMLARRKKRGLMQKIYKKLSLGWCNTQRFWEVQHTTLYYFAAIAAPLVISVHSIVSNDFAVTTVVGWNSTIFPPFFVAGAIFSGFALTLTLLITIRKILKLKQYITVEIIESLNKIILATSIIIASAYAIEIYVGLFSGNEHEYVLMHRKLFGDFSIQFYSMLICNVFLPQLFWFKKMRKSIIISFAISIFINIGMWLERFIIVVNSLQNSQLPARDGFYNFSIVEILLFVGTLSFFLLFFLILTRFVPVISINEMKAYKGLGHDMDEVDIPKHCHSKDKSIVIAVFPNEDVFVKAQREIEKTYEIVEVTMPNYVKMESKTNYRIPFVGLISGIVGGLAAFIFQIYVMGFSNPLNFGGKPFLAYPSFVPVVFECAVLFAGIGMFVAMLIYYKRARSQTKYMHHFFYNYFAIAIKTDKKEYTKNTLMHLGAINII